MVICCSRSLFFPRCLCQMNDRYFDFSINLNQRCFPDSSSDESIAKKVRVEFLVPVFCVFVFWSFLCFIYFSQILSYSFQFCQFVSSLSMFIPLYLFICLFFCYFLCLCLLLIFTPWFVFPFSFTNLPAGWTIVHQDHFFKSLAA